MKRTDYLSTKTSIVFYVLLLFNLICFFYFLLRVSKNHYFIWDALIIVFIIIVNCIFGGLYHFMILIPEARIKETYLLFSKGSIYEELFSSENMIFREQEMVMECFHHLLDKQDAINLSKKQAEYLALQNQINPHFLYNTLEAIRGDAIYAGLNNIADTTEALASFFRYTITDMGNLVSLEDEIENCQNYFTIQQYRFGDKLDMQINYPVNEPTLPYLLVPKLTLQPIVENAIFHGLEQMIGTGTIQLIFETTSTRLFINVTDNGIGIEPDILKQLNDDLDKSGISYVRKEPDKSGGIALRNVARRIKLLFGDEYGLHLYSIPNLGTTVHVTLPKLAKDDLASFNRKDAHTDETRTLQY